MNHFRNLYSTVLDYSVAGYLYLPCYPATGVLPCYPAMGVLPCYPATGDMWYYGYFSSFRLIGDNGVMISGHFRCQFLPLYAMWAGLKHQARQGTWWHLGKHHGTPRQSSQKSLTGAIPRPSSSVEAGKDAKGNLGTNSGRISAAPAMTPPKTGPTQICDSKKFSLPERN